jgi:hypothetical protein
MEVEERELEAPLREQIERRNHAAAVALAQQLGKPAEIIKELQGGAIKQYIIEYRNAPGATALIQEFRFTSDEVSRYRGMGFPVREDAEASGKPLEPTEGPLRGLYLRPT